jgi:hypothetical protein
LALRVFLAFATSCGCVLVAIGWKLEPVTQIIVLSLAFSSTLVT